MPDSPSSPCYAEPHWKETPPMPLSRRTFTQLSAFGLAARWTPPDLRPGRNTVPPNRLCRHRPRSHRHPFSRGHAQLGALQNHRIGQRSPRQSRAYRRPVRRAARLHLQLPGLRPHRRQPRRRRRLRRATQQHARGIHHSRRQGRQARPLREAHGCQFRAVRPHDRRLQSSPR